MLCPKCKDKIRGLYLPEVVTSGVMYREDGDAPATDLCSYPELEAQTVEPDIRAVCMDCDHEGELRDFFPGDVNA